MAARELSPRQRQIIKFITDYYRQNGYGPSVREIGQNVGLSSPASVQNQIRNLKNMGYLKHCPSKSRTLMPSDLLREETKTVKVPIIGQISAGVGVDALETPEGYLELPAEIIPKSDCFILRVQGDSMKDAAILDGDLVIVKRQQTVNNNQIAAVGIDGQAVVKRIKIKEDKIILTSENSEFAPIEKNLNEVEVYGIVVAVIRKYLH